MDLTWISIADTAVKIGFGATISALSGYFVLVKKQGHEDRKEQRKYFHMLQEEKKSKYVEFLSLSQELIQNYLYDSCSPAADDYKRYLRIFNEVQIISSDAIRVTAFEAMHAVQSFILLRKNQQEHRLLEEMVKDARKKISKLQKVAQKEVTRRYQYT
ncbi:hypothetical protein ABE957_10535 [Halomonas sp. CS7]|uniref:Uncharacterized protein n=1 Tax=Halomonas pelophila TaxID=3151122 RepID=A0ABV1N5V0_9GAMM